MRTPRDFFERKLAELHVRQSVTIGAIFGDGEQSDGRQCQFCEQPPARASLCSEHWEECVQNALASVRQRRELRKAQKGAVTLCSHCRSGKQRYACSYCGASGQQARPGFVFCPCCHGSGLKYGHTPCVRCAERGILTEQAFYAGLTTAQAAAFKQALLEDGVNEPRLCRELSEMSWALHVSLYFGEHSYKSYSVDPEGTISVVGG